MYSLAWSQSNSCKSPLGLFHSYRIAMHTSPKVGGYCSAAEVSVGERDLVTCHTTFFQAKWTKKVINTLVGIIIVLSLLSRIPLMVTFVFNTMPPVFCRSAFRLFTVNSFIDACGNSFGPLIVLTFFTIATAREHGKILKLSTSQNEIRQARYRAHKSIMILLCSMNILCATYFSMAALD